MAINFEFFIEINFEEKPEVDFVIQKQNEIIPIEVKSSGKGSMQSMYQFLKEKKYNKGIRISMENFPKINEIQIIPLYAIRNLYQSDI